VNVYESILVPLDGTAFGEHALPVAVEVARRTGATLHLVHVHTPGSAWTPLEGMMPGSSAGRPVTQVEDRAYLEEVLEGLRREVQIKGDVRVLEGPIGRSVAEGAQAAGVDLIVMSTHGRTGLSRLWHHDVAGYLTRHLSVPVLAVPMHEEDPAAATAPSTTLSRVVVPLGGKLHNTGVLEEVATFCRALSGSVTLVRVVEPPMEIGYTLLGQDAHVNPYLQEDLDEEARGALNEAVTLLRSRNVPVELAVARGGNPAEAILEFARGLPGGAADVIAMETHGLGTVRHLFAPSVVEAVLHGSSVPVLLHHADAAAESELAYEDNIRARMGWARPSEAHHLTPPLA
jgi:nucleotide-binding universal stress UspA family protein